jgi:acyl transferase domain-containing protein
VIILEEAPVASGKALNGGIHTNGTHTNGVSQTNGNGHSNGHTNGGVALPDPELEPVKRLYALSAKSENSLVAYVSSFLEYLENAPSSGSFLRDLSYTLGQRRTHYAHRIVVVADSLADLKSQLSVAKSKKIKDRHLTFAFTGQGAQ